ncbi:IPT/TIG domain-containing protein (plasmid) [Streptomyces sp. BI20]|uniref:IPT/TIG domain-containing protein n=1 Tax=Streptomyces sp. BI20 TaxID=3403460 RepID=UPI003C74DB92
MTTPPPPPPAPPIPQKGATAWDGPLNLFLAWVRDRLNYYARSEIQLRDRLTIIENESNVPALDAVAPESGKAGDTLTLTVRNVKKANPDVDTVMVGHKPATDFVFVTDHKITCKVPAGMTPARYTVSIRKGSKALAWRTDCFEVKP